jgi:hypothetical protein
MDVYLLVAIELWRPAYLSTNNKHSVMTSYPTLTSCEHYFVRGDRQDVINDAVFKKKAFLRVWLHTQTNNEFVYTIYCSCLYGEPESSRAKNEFHILRRISAGVRDCHKAVQCSGWVMALETEAEGGNGGLWVG